MTDVEVLRAVERRTLWLASAMVHHANSVRPNRSGVKVGGHQASSASMTSIMTALWFHALTAQDRVSVKPHAAPVLHAINYLLGELDEPWLTTLRAYRGLQSYPSRVKDPDPVDYSTGSVGIGATAPIWGAVTRRYVADHFGGSAGRQYSLIGDAELDEGACWEAIVDPIVPDLGEVCWVVDLNRQSLDRVVPNMATHRLQGMFAAAGWQVITLKYGRRLRALFDRPGGDALRERIDAMGNPEYQRLLRLPAEELRGRLPGDGPTATAVKQLVADVDDAELYAAVRDLGGHDLADLVEAYGSVADDRPTVVFAYTVKGYGLPTAGHPQNHSALLTDAQLRDLAEQLGTGVEQPWRRFADGTPEAALCAATAARLRREPVAATEPPVVPADLGRTPTGRVSTQQVLGRALLDLVRDAPQVAERVVTVSPDVASSTNLGGWINKVGAWNPREGADWFADDAETLLHWRERPTGQHVELGIAEVNLVGLLGELGTAWSRWGQPLLPIGTVYDPFVTRALEPWSFGIYGGGQSILVGTPSGVTLAPEGGAHQSIITPSVGIEQPGCVAYEPAFALDFEWCLLAALGRLGRPDGTSAYFRLSTRPLDQALAAVPADPAGRQARRRQVVAGGYRLRTAADPALTIAVTGAVVPEALAAADRLAGLGFPADVLCLTSADLVYRAVRARRGLGVADEWILDDLLPADRARPMVTLLDGHPHTLAFLATVHGVPVTSLGVTEFGQSGDVDDVYRHHGIDADTVVGAALDLVD
jgi:pyruvate dehydrogenase E1 component